jgi:hypothetical protein
MEAVQDVCPSVEKASSNLVNGCKDIFAQLAGVNEKKISERKRRVFWRKSHPSVRI